MVQERASSGTEPLLVEVIGPAGAGKSTLLERASEADGSVAALRLEMRKFTPAAVLRMLCLLPLGRAYRTRLRQLFRQEICRIAAREARETSSERTPCRFVLLDEGPVYRLVRRRAVGYRGRQTRGLEDWGRALVRRWAESVDVILWLDAPDPVLIQRMRTRDKLHAMKNGTDDEIGRFLQRYRQCYREVLGEIAPEGGSRILHVDTGHEPPGRMAQAVLSRLEGSAS